MQKRGPEEGIGIYSPKLVRGAFGNGNSSALCILVQVFNEPQTSRNARAVRKAFLGVVYGEI